MATMTRWWWVSGTLLLACAGGEPAKKLQVSRPASSAPGAATALGAPGPAQRPAPTTPKPALSADSDAGSGRRALGEFQAFLKEQGELDYPALAQRLGLSPKEDRALGFDPTTVRYFADIERELKLTPDERRLFRAQGFVSIDHQQGYSMASAYYAIYTRDLPVLVTTDSILHALHRSFDTTLRELELTSFRHVIDATLSRASDGIPALAPNLRLSAEDVDLYITVARNLLAGLGGAADEGPAPGDPKRPPPAPGKPAPLLVAPRLVPPAAVSEVLAKISSLATEDPYGPCTRIYGGRRCVDWSQFKPRGHYTYNKWLGRYFRALMWLGRVDLGFALRAPDPASQFQPNVERERRDAALLTVLLDQSGQLDHLANMARIIDFLVGRSDSVTLETMRDALAHAKIRSPASLADGGALEAFDQALDGVGARAQQIRSQLLGTDSGTAPTKLPLVFQPFGQRFVIDSFALSNVVYDSIIYKGEKQKRFMPTGLDVMAALGNDLAVELSEPALEQFHYGSNLLAVRRVVDAMQPDDWNANAYNQWLGTLRTLDDPPAAKAHFPRVMRRDAWRKKQLRAALASWAELRHDTVLYAKQSYTGVPLCEYPQGFVEPYPEFFAKLGALTSTLSDRLSASEVPAGDPDSAKLARDLRDRHAAFFKRFSATMATLEELAKKELASRPFTKEEQDFFRKTTDDRGGGSGPPRYDGWYPKLINEAAFERKPSIADVHTGPADGSTLEVAVGDPQFLIVAIDNGPNRAAYVGPSYSYYEFTRAGRMTDEEWTEALDTGKAPPPPAFTSAFAPAGTKRTLDRPKHPHR